MSNNRKRSFAEFSEDAPTLQNPGVTDTVNLAEASESSNGQNEGREHWVVALNKKQRKRLNRQKRKKTKDDAKASAVAEETAFVLKTQGDQIELGGKTDSSKDAENANIVSPDKESKATNNRPGLSYAPHRINSIVKLSQLQELILYCLADGVAPNWISMKYHNQIQKAVVLFVPGLEQAMFSGKISLSLNAATNGYEALIAQAENRASSPPKYDKSPDDFLPVPLAVEQLPDALKPLSDIFSELWPIKAPGDDKFFKVHSPLHAMLTAPVSRAAEKKKGVKPPNVKQDWKDQPTLVTSFLMTTENLIENRYVLHPTQAMDDLDRRAYLDERIKSGTSYADGWRDTPVQNTDLEMDSFERATCNAGDLSGGLTVLTLDCEMCMVGEEDYALTRISVVRWDGKVLLDELVKPDKPIINYVTQFSGITKEMIDPVTTTLRDIQQRILDLVDSRTILVGHSLDSDLHALKLTHPFVIDTAILYPHPRGPPLKSSLKWLAQKYLDRKIQKGDGKDGHNSIEDAKTCLDLVKQKCAKGPLWGTNDATSEPIFKRLSRAPRNGAASGERADGKRGAIVDVGSGKSFRMMAPYSIGCTTDAEVVDGVKRCVLGDDDGLEIPGGGLEFTWARFRVLERLRGWSNDNRSAVPLEEREVTKEPTSAQLHVAVSDVVSYIKEIHAALPPCTLFMVYSGTGDPREHARLSELHRTFKKEYATKKWDDLSVKWTDEEDQALRKACWQARKGMALMCVT